MLDLLAEAAEWIARRAGTTNWPERFPRALITGNAERGELYVVEQDAATIATLTLQWTTSSSGERRARTAPPATCTASPCGARTPGGGLGYRLLDWADEQVRARSGRGSCGSTS